MSSNSPESAKKGNTHPIDSNKPKVVKAHKPPNRGALAIGLILITVGILLLIENLMPTFSFAKTWPIFIIIWGLIVIISSLVPPIKAGRIISGFTISVIGFILLGNTFNLVPFSFWLDLLSLWPILLIAAGIAIIGEVTRNRVLKILPGLIILATMLLAFFYNGVIFQSSSANTFFDFKDADPVIKEGIADLGVYAGRFRIGSTNKLYEVRGKDIGGTYKPNIKLNKSDSNLNLSIKPVGNPIIIRTARSQDWDIKLSKQVEWVLFANAAVSRLDFDLNDLKVKKLTIDGGVNDAVIRFGNKTKQIDALIKAGVSNISVFIPNNTGVSLSIKGGLISTVFKDLNFKLVRKEENFRVYETAGFDEAKRKIILNVDMGVTNLVIQGY